MVETKETYFLKENDRIAYIVINGDKEIGQLVCNPKTKEWYFNPFSESDAYCYKTLLILSNKIQELNREAENV